MPRREPPGRRVVVHQHLVEQQRRELAGVAVVERRVGARVPVRPLEPRRPARRARARAALELLAATGSGPAAAGRRAPRAPPRPARGSAARRGRAAARSAPAPRAARPARPTGAPARRRRACASRNGMPLRTSCSARSVAADAGASAAARIALGDELGRRRAARPAPTEPASSVSSASNSGSLSSCRSRLYASGRPLSVARKPVRSPIRRPALPRASSAMSGFFFCGSIDDPVLYASASRRKPNSSLDQSTISSPRREQVHLLEREHEQRLGDEVAVGDRVERVLEAARRTRGRAAAPSGSSGRLDPASAPAPSGDTSARPSASRQRSTSRASAQKCASRWCASSTGCARCRCV